MKEYIDAWCANLANRSSIPLEQEGEAWGEYTVHTGPSFWRAKVKLSLTNAGRFQVVESLSRDKAASLKHYGYFDYIIFGVLDVLLSDVKGPHKLFVLDILDAEINEIESNQMAFRLAARDAVTKILSGL